MSLKFSEGGKTETMWLNCLVVLVTLFGFVYGREHHFGPCIFVIGGKCPDPKNINVYLYTRLNPERPQFVYLNATWDNVTTSSFNLKRPNKLIIHGYNADMYLDALQNIKAEYLKQGDYNVWTVNWARLCRGPCYPFAVYNLRHVGECLAQLILALRRHIGSNPLDLHAIGFSLGAHVGNYLALSLAPYKMPRFTGLDPAMLLFIGVDKDRKLDKSDALFVDVIHTNALVQGTIEEIGHVDFYVNGGVSQPGCRNDSNPIACDHQRAAEYFAESVTTDVGFLSWSCSGFIQYILGSCKPKNNTVPMGEKVPNSTRGFYVTYTADAKPYALGPWTGSRFINYTRVLQLQETDEHNTTLPPTVQMVT